MCCVRSAQVMERADLEKHLPKVLANLVSEYLFW
jgi:hypothetical protein